MLTAAQQYAIPVVVLVAAYLVGNFSPGCHITRRLGKGDVRTQGSGGTGATNVGRVLGKKWFFAVLSLDMLKAAFAVLVLPWLCSVNAGKLEGVLRISEWGELSAPLPPDTFAQSVHTTSVYVNGELSDVLYTIAPSLAFHVACGLAVIAGHIWPVLLKFRGGKGVAPFLGVWLAGVGIMGLPSLALPVGDGSFGVPVALLIPLTLLAPIVAALFFLPLRKGAFMSALCGLWAQPLAFWLLTHDLAATVLASLIVVCILIAHRTNFNKAFGKKTTDCHHA